MIGFQIGESEHIIGDEEFYIIWTDANLPIIKSNANAIFSNLDDVTSVSFDTWLLSVDRKLIIEFYHDGDITMGLICN